MAALLVPCVHLLPYAVQACALGALGNVRAEAPNLPSSQSDTGLYAAVGARGGTLSADGTLLTGPADAYPRESPGDNVGERSFYLEHVAD